MALLGTTILSPVLRAFELCEHRPVAIRLNLSMITPSIVLTPISFYHQVESIRYQKKLLSSDINTHNP